MECFKILVNGYQSLTNITKRSILHVAGQPGPTRDISFFINISESIIIKFLDLGLYFVVTLSVYVYNDRLRKFVI